MATIDSKKLLPPSKSSGSSLATQKFLVPISNIKPKSSAIIRASDITSTKKVEEGELKSDSQIIKIEKNVIQIEKIIGSNNTLLKSIEEKKRKDSEKQKFEKREKKLEEKKGGGLPSLKAPSLPRTGFLDAIKRFLFYTLLGAAFVKFGKYIPKILEFTKKLIPAIKFLEDFAGNLLNGVVEFIDKGYKAYDKVREIVKFVGGENAEKKFDEFSKQFNTFANLAIIAGMSTMGGTDFSGKGTKPGKFGRPTKPSTLTNNSKLSGYLGRDPQTKLIERRYGNDAARMYEARKSQGASVNRARADVLKRFETLENKFGPQKGLGGGTGKGSLFSRGLGRSFNRASLNVLGKTGTRVVKGVFGKIPIIGGLVDFIISTVILKENPGRAAAKAVGATIGSALGTFIPIPFAGTILGGILGDIVGGALYDSLVGNNTKVKAKAQGGQVTRGGKKVSGPSRRIRRVASKPPKVRPQKTTPGKDVGGRKEIEKLFPYTVNPNQKNPLGVLETTSESLKKIPLLGGIMGAAVDLTMGQKPDSNVFKRIGYGFGWLIQNAINAETASSIGNIQKEIVGLAGGGVVPRTLSTGESIGMKIGQNIAKTLEAIVNSKVTETLQAIRQQFGKEGFGLTGPDGGGGGGDGGPLTQSQQEAFEKIRKIAEKVGSPKPEVTAAIAMIETGWLANPNSVYFASGKTNPFGQTGRGPKGSVTGKDGQEHAVYNSLEEGVKAHVDRWKSSYIGKTPQEIIESIRTGRGAGAPGMYNTNPSWTSKVLSAYQSGTQPRPSSTPSKGAAAAVLPRGNPVFTSGFGSRWGRQHRGIDIGVDANSPVTALQDGEVTDIYKSFGGHGDGVVVTHSDGTRIVYGHVNSKVRKGEKIKKGQTIATVKGWFNAYGNKDNTHLHLERYVSGVATDPTGYLNSLVPKPGARPASPPPPGGPRQNLTRKNQWDPSRSGLRYNEKTKQWEKASIAPSTPLNIAEGIDQETKKSESASIALSTPSNIAEGLNQKASWEIAGTSTIMLQKVIVEKPVPVSAGSGMMMSLGFIDSSSNIS